MRIIGGIWGGRRLVAPKGAATRPTGDKAKGALFSILGDLEGVRVLDLFAGTGAIGLEALSRGAASVTFVERARPALEALATNIRALGAKDATVRGGDVRAALDALVKAGAAFELIYADPPYEEAEALLPKVLTAAVTLLGEGGHVILEHRKSDPSPAPPPGLGLVDERRYGEAALAFYQKAT